MTPLAARRIGFPLAIAWLASSCALTPEAKQETVYGPSESVLEIIAVLRRHVPDDTYRFPPATDFSGRNVYRASLLRLENLETNEADALRAGHMDAVIAFSKARALERLRAFDLAAGLYRIAAQRSATLREEAERSASLCDDIHEAARQGIDLPDALDPSREEGLPLDAEAVVADLDERVAKLSELSERASGSHYTFILREEIERADVTRAHYFRATRQLTPNGNVRAVAETQRVAARHAPSRNRRGHLLALANLYAEIAHEYVAARPPESLSFDPPRFSELVDAASQIYRAVATQDGTTEKLEAARRLEAFLAFTLQVDRDRFTP